MKKFLENLNEAEKLIKIADHLIYRVFPMGGNKRVLLRALEEIKNSVSLCISSVLQFEFIHGRINLCKDSRENFKTFAEKCATRHKITKEEVKFIIELFDFIDKHKKSSMEFVKNNKVVILSDQLESRTLTIEKTKELLETSKSILRKARSNIFP